MTEFPVDRDRIVWAYDRRSGNFCGTSKVHCKQPRFAARFCMSDEPEDPWFMRGR